MVGVTPCQGSFWPPPCRPLLPLLPRPRPPSCLVHRVCGPAAGDGADEAGGHACVSAMVSGPEDRYVSTNTYFHATIFW